MFVQRACWRGARRGEGGDSRERVRSASAISRTGSAGNLSCPILDPPATVCLRNGHGRRFASAPLLSRHPSSAAHRGSNSRTARPFLCSFRRSLPVRQGPWVRGGDGGHQPLPRGTGRSATGDRACRWDLAVGRRCLMRAGPVSGLIIIDLDTADQPLLRILPAQIEEPDVWDTSRCARSASSPHTQTTRSCSRRQPSPSSCPVLCTPTPVPGHPTRGRSDIGGHARARPPPRVFYTTGGTWATSRAA